jgi:hypothetical protein
MKFIRIGAALIVFFFILQSFAEYGVDVVQISEFELKAMEMLTSMNNYLIALAGGTAAFVLSNGKHIHSLALKKHLGFQISFWIYAITTVGSIGILLWNQYTLFHQLQSEFFNTSHLIGENTIFGFICVCLISFVFVSVKVFGEQYESKN